MCCICIGDPFGLPLRGGLDDYGRPSKTPIHLLDVVRPHICYVCMDGKMGSVCKASAPYHEYVTERPSAFAAPASLSGSLVAPCLPARKYSSVQVRREGTDPSERKTVEESKPGGPRLDWVLCLTYLAIISGPHRAREREKRFQLSIHPRQIEGFPGRSSKQASKRASTLGLGHYSTQHTWAAEEGAGILKLKVKNPGLPAFAALAAQIVTSAGWADVIRLCLYQDFRPMM